MKAVNEIIRDLREDRDLRQVDVAKIIGTTQQHYSRCEKGESELPARAVIALANYYKVSTDFLLGRTDCKQGVDALNQLVTKEYTTGRLLTDVLSLDNTGRHAVIDYIDLQKIKNKVTKISK